jgi:putative flippase GtrA
MHLFKAIFNTQKTTGLPHFIRYALVSGVALAADVGILVFTHDILGQHYLLAATIGFLCGVVVNYALCVVWVFSASRFSSRTVEFLLTAGFATAGLAVNDFIMWSLVDKLAMSYLIAKLIAAVAVFVWNFMVRQYYVHAAVPTSETN